MPKSLFRRLTKRFFLFVTIGVVAVFLLACLAPYLNPTRWWPIAFLGLGFPFLVILLFASLVFWLFAKPRIALLPLIALLIGWQNISAFFAFNTAPGFKQEKQAGRLRVMSWNVARFVEMRRNNNQGSATRARMMELIKGQDADIVCLQEFFSSYNPEWYNNVEYIKKEMNYPYHCFTMEDDGYLHFKGSVIFSRHPIIDSGMLIYPRPSLPEGLVFADIKYNNDTLRVYTTHLQSVQFNRYEREKAEKLSVEDSIILASRPLLSKIKRGFAYRSIQTEIVRNELKKSPYKKIFCADFNDVPNSYTYFQVRGNMQDAFLQKGFGLGRTYSGISPTLRIDYILADKAFKTEQFKKMNVPLSDHYPIVADFSLRGGGGRD
jgi:endonuclease/exonuclease/phosphatase family metal-dependent hydrolase